MMSLKEILVEIQKIQKQYPDTTAMNEVDFEGHLKAWTVDSETGQINSERFPILFYKMAKTIRIQRILIDWVLRFAWRATQPGSREIQPDTTNEIEDLLNYFVSKEEL